MKVSHESPLQMLEFSRGYNDYDYALVHLFEKSEEYYRFFVDSLKMGREVILDNSIFELGEAFHMEDFLYWINELNPTYYIVPDVLDDAEGTMSNLDIWMKEYAPRVKGNSKIIGVCQGKTYDEIVKCYNFVKQYADRIAFSFDSAVYGYSDDSELRCLKYMTGRQMMIFRMVREGVIDKTKEHHLLGCALPQEFRVYKDMNFITSCDTSNPVVHGLKNIRYTRDGLERKETEMLCNLLEAKVTLEQYDCILHNVNIFKEFAR